MTIYLDNNATTALDPRVFQAMLEEFLGSPANPSSNHTFGKRGKELLNKSREKIASFFGLKTDEIIFTSSATEGLNTIIKGLFVPNFKGHIITTDIEHAAVFNSIKTLQNWGCDVSFLKVGALGAPLPEQVEQAITKNTKLIVLSAVNSETGVKTDIQSIGLIAAKYNIPFLVDGVALLGKESFSTLPIGVSAMVFSGHKIHAPKGIGLVFCRSSFKFIPLLHGGAQEGNKRAGTENLASIIGLSTAIEILKTELPSATHHMQRLRDYFEEKLKEKLPFIKINGLGERICNTSNITFEGIDGETLLIALDRKGLYASLGSACSSGAIEPSRVLLNMGIKRELAKSSLRFSLSRLTTQDEIDKALKLIETSAHCLKK